MYWALIFPVDVVKSAMQSDAIEPNKRQYPTASVALQVRHACLTAERISLGGVPLVRGILQQLHMPASCVGGVTLLGASASDTEDQAVPAQPDSLESSRSLLAAETVGRGGHRQILQGLHPLHHPCHASQCVHAAHSRPCHSVPQQLIQRPMSTVWPGSRLMTLKLPAASAIVD